MKKFSAYLIKLAQSLIQEEINKEARNKKDWGGSEPVDKDLYYYVRSLAKEKFDVWPSAYASGWMVKEYKRRFKEKHGGRKSPYKKTSSDENNLKKEAKKKGLTKWFDEKWVRMNSEGDIVGPCGRDDADEKGGYPKCLPEAKAKDMTKDERARIVRRKRRTERKNKGKGKGKKYRSPNYTSSNPEKGATRGKKKK